MMKIVKNFWMRLFYCFSNNWIYVIKEKVPASVIEKIDQYAQKQIDNYKKNNG